MNSRLIIIILAFLLASCTDRTSRSKTNIAVNNQIDNLRNARTDSFPTTFDSTLTLFTDTSYKLTLHIFDTKSFNEETSNSTVTFNHIKGNKIERIFQDSFYCMSPLVEFQDFNNDRIKDVLFLYYTGGRSNPTYHLYLVDTVNNKLTYVRGFENLPNPDLDSSNNIISSYALSGGEVGVSFYRINPDLKLVNLGHSFDSEFGDDKPFDKATKAIVKERGK